jgi:hypothetical protein
MLTAYLLLLSGYQLLAQQVYSCTAVVRKNPVIFGSGSETGFDVFTKSKKNPKLFISKLYQLLNGFFFFWAYNKYS